MHNASTERSPSDIHKAGTKDADPDAAIQLIPDEAYLIEFRRPHWKHFIGSDSKLLPEALSAG